MPSSARLITGPAAGTAKRRRSFCTTAPPHPRRTSPLKVTVPFRWLRRKIAAIAHKSNTHAFFFQNRAANRTSLKNRPCKRKSDRRHAADKYTSRSSQAVIQFRANTPSPLCDCPDARLDRSLLSALCPRAIAAMLAVYRNGEYRGDFAWRPEPAFAL